MNATALKIHSMKGRTRLRVAYRDQVYPGFWGELRANLKARPEIKDFQLSPRTRSVVLYHDVDDAQLDAACVSAGMTIASADEHPIGRPSRLAHLVVNSAKNLDQALLDASDGWLDLKTAGILGLGLMGVWQVRRGNFLPAGFTLLLTAYDLASAQDNS